MFHVYFHGALRVILDEENGAILSVQDRISGADARFRFSPDYIDAAKIAAFVAWESTIERV